MLVYKIVEPNFSCPIKTTGKNLVIRNDAKGDGEFGAKRRNGRTHSGIDISAGVGTPVYASRSGLLFCGNVPTGYGKYVMIYHPDGYQTIYGHLSDWSEYSVRKARRGEIIGFVGKTGNAAGKAIQPHLHFEIKKDGAAQDPRGLMKTDR
ncbi:MAG: M23 family metallopeptidase [Candidatus Omnitrophica bacterium]|nr:M23 family metallopeptidase [Candidatus Omnitrophota bacterium]